MAKINHLSHGIGGEVATGHAVPGNLARDGAPKKIHAIMVHPGMRATPKSGGDALSGHEASAIDALSGQTVVPGTHPTVYAPTDRSDRAGNAGHPFAKAPGSKRLTKVAPAFGMRSRGPMPDADLHELGSAVLAQAVRCK